MKRQYMYGNVFMIERGITVHNLGEDCVCV